MATPATRRALSLLLASAGTLALLASPAAGQPSVPGTPYVLDGPSAAISHPADLGVSVARDGTGGLVYLKSVNGTPHVFVSQLASGAFQPPVQVDGEFAGGSSQPVIAAGNGGLLLVGFINGGELYVVDRNGAGQFGSPLALAGGAINPAISITNFGKAYLAFALADSGGYDVRTAYYDNGSWALEGPPLNGSPGDDAGSGSGRPAVAAAGDGIAIVVWGEHGHIYSRRVWGTTPSEVYEQADAAPGGCTQNSVDQPVVSAGGDSSYAPVGFHAVLTCGGPQQSRVLMNRLHGSVYDGVTAADGLSGSSPDGANDPQVAVGEYGGGWVTSARTVSNNVFAASLGNDGAFGGTVVGVNSLPASVSPYPVPALAGLHADLIAWQQAPGSSPGGDIRLRFAGDGVSLGPEIVMSSPAQGPTDAADGLAAGGDQSGDVAVAWLQGTAGATSLVVNELYQPPGTFSPQQTQAYSNSSRPVVSWQRPAGWGPMKYTVRVDGSPVGQTYSTSMQVPASLPDGPHNWRVIAANPAGQQRASALAAVFVDTVPPRGGVRLLGGALAGSILRVLVRYFDRPPAGEYPADASGVGSVLVRWGDGSFTRVVPGEHLLGHRYRRAGRYRIMLVVRDRAGNVTRLFRFVKVKRGG